MLCLQHLDKRLTKARLLSSACSVLGVPFIQVPAGVFSRRLPTLAPLLLDHCCAEKDQDQDQEDPLGRGGRRGVGWEVRRRGIGWSPQTPFIFFQFEGFRVPDPWSLVRPARFPFGTDCVAARIPWRWRRLGPVPGFEEQGLERVPELAQSLTLAPRTGTRQGPKTARRRFGPPAF